MRDATAAVSAPMDGAGEPSRDPANETGDNEGDIRVLRARDRLRVRRLDCWSIVTRVLRAVAPVFQNGPSRSFLATLRFLLPSQEASGIRRKERL